MKTNTTPLTTYKPTPRISSTIILSIGILSFVLASVYPPLLLLVACLLCYTIPYSFRVNDSGEARRVLWNEFLKRDDLPVELRCGDVVLEEKYWANERCVVLCWDSLSWSYAILTHCMSYRVEILTLSLSGMCLLTSTMVPKNNAPIRAVICFCHGYMDNASFLKRIEYQRFVQKGFAVVMIEYEGHGRSDGTNALIPCWETMISDVQQYFHYITQTKFPGKKVFLMGESMGGAVAFDLMSRYRSCYEGVIFVCPMVKVMIVPPAWVVNLFYKIVGASGTVNSFSVMPFAPSKGNIPMLSFKVKEKMLLATSVPTGYGRKPRLATARELLVSNEAQNHLDERNDTIHTHVNLIVLYLQRILPNAFLHRLDSLMRHSSFFMDSATILHVQRSVRISTRSLLRRTRIWSCTKVCICVMNEYHPLEILSYLLL